MIRGTPLLSLERCHSAPFIQPRGGEGGGPQDPNLAPSRQVLQAPPHTPSSASSSLDLASLSSGAAAEAVGRGGRAEEGQDGSRGSLASRSGAGPAGRRVARRAGADSIVWRAARAAPFADASGERLLGPCSPLRPRSPVKVTAGRLGVQASQLGTASATGAHSPAGFPLPLDPGRGEQGRVSVSPSNGGAACGLGGCGAGGGLSGGACSARCPSGLADPRAS